LLSKKFVLIAPQKYSERVTTSPSKRAAQPRTRFLPWLVVPEDSSCESTLSTILFKHASAPRVGKNWEKSDLGHCSKFWGLANTSRAEEYGSILGPREPYSAVMPAADRNLSAKEEVGGLVRILLGGLLKPTLKLLNVVLSKACDGFPNRSSRLVGRSLRPARTRRSIAYATVTGNLFNGFCHLSIEDRTAALSPHAPLRLQWSGHGDEHSFHHRASAYHSDVDTGVRAGANSTCVRPIHAGGSYVD